MGTTMRPGEERFLQKYDMTKYDRPSVTVDGVMLSLDRDDDLRILLIRRGRHPFKGCWALPGGFIRTSQDPDGRESLDDAVAREVMEETGLKAAWSEQLYTYGDPTRDPRGHVISVAYLSAIPTNKLDAAVAHAADDADDARWFVLRSANPLTLDADGQELGEDELAFDHATIIRDAVRRLAGKVMWTDVATRFVGDGETFTMTKLRRFCETVLSLDQGETVTLDKGNFHRAMSKRLMVAQMEQTHGPRTARRYKRP